MVCSTGGVVWDSYLETDGGAEGIEDEEDKNAKEKDVGEGKDHA